MDRETLLAIFDREQRLEIEFPGTHREQVGSVIREITGGDEPHRGFIAYSHLRPETADEDIDAQITFFQSKHMDFEWKVFDHDQPTDLRQRLVARGFEPGDPEALMVLDVNTAPDWYWSMDLPNVTRVTEQAGVDAVSQLEAEVWNEDQAWLGAELWRNLRERPDLLSVFAVYDGSRTVSAAWIYYHPPTQFASLWGGSTLADYRRRGYYTQLLAVRAREARQHGFRFLTVDASPMSRPILEKHGFQFLGFSADYRWHSPADVKGESHV